MNTRKAVQGRTRWYAGLGVLVGGLLWLATPVEACGCGAYIPRGGNASASQERALIHWDGQTEQIIMELGVEGRSDEAAWIVPVPAPATVQLGDSKLFEELHELTKPRVEYQFTLGMQGDEAAGSAQGAAGAPPPVTVLERQTLGPLDVSTLAATDAAALSNWLATNGYTFPRRLEQVLQYYVDNEWFYVAVKLVPGADGQSLTGTLDPLWLTFDTPQIVYPMRPSSLARDSLSVVLYIVADHRVENPIPSVSGIASDVTYADWIDPATLDASSPLTSVVQQTQFLTKIESVYWTPEAITSDYTFAYAAQDTTYQATEFKTINIGGFVCLGVLGMGLLAWIVSIWWTTKD